MTIGQRIKARREELNMSQETLAKKIGYASRSSINKIELDKYSLQQTKIKAIADALDTTPAYIMGWEDETPAPDSRDERLDELRCLASQLSEEQLKMIIAQIRGLLAVAELNPAAPAKAAETELQAHAEDR